MFNSDDGYTDKKLDLCFDTIKERRPRHTQTTSIMHITQFREQIDVIKS